TLSNNACSGSLVADGSAVAIAGTGTQHQSSLPASCYTWRLTATDNVGNVTTFDSAEMVVDPTAPSTPALTLVAVHNTGLYYSGTGSTVYVESGSDNTNFFTVQASSA